MSQGVQGQNPAVVLRSHYVHVRALLATAVVAVVGLTLALVIVASNGDSGGTSATSRPTPSVKAPFNGGHEEGMLGSSATRRPSAVRYDGGPEEGTRGSGR